MLMMLKMNQMMVMMWRACCRWPEDDDLDDDKNDDLEDNDDQNDGDDGDDEDDIWYREQIAGGPSGEERIGDVPEGAKRTRTPRETNANWDFGEGDSNAVDDDDGDGGDAYDDEKDEGGYEWEEHKLSFD